MLASLKAFPRPGITGADLSQDKARARELFDRVMKTIELEDTRANGQSASKMARGIAEDVEMHAEIARLWQDENLDRTGKALREALRIGQGGAKETDPLLVARLTNNIGVLHHLEGRHGEARAMYEGALTNVTTVKSDVAEGLSTTMLYNLARVYEDQGEDDMAKGAYEKLLSRHPEYVDGKFTSYFSFQSLCNV